MAKRGQFQHKLIGFYLSARANADTPINTNPYGRPHVSIHELDVHDETVNSVMVGWEKALGSFFAHVYLAGDGSGYPCPSREIGGDFHEIKEPELVIAFVRDYADVPADLAATLTADAATEGVC